MAGGWRCCSTRAHNLVDRARLMRTGELDQDPRARPAPPAPKAALLSLDKLERAWKALNASASDGGEDKTGATPGYRVLPALPDELMGALRQAATAVLDHLAGIRPRWTRACRNFLFDALHPDEAGRASGHSLCDLSRSRDGRTSVLCLRNVVPAPFLEPRAGRRRRPRRCSRRRCSRRLSPRAARALSAPPGSTWTRPSRRSQLDIHIARDISTRWQHRDASVARSSPASARSMPSGPGLPPPSAASTTSTGLPPPSAQHPEVPVWARPGA